MTQDKKHRIMQAAEALFKARQFHEITLDEVAREADVGKGTIYLYFSDKEDLFFQTAVAGFDEMCDLLQKNAPKGVAFRGGLLWTCQVISDFFRERRPLFRMIQAEGTRVQGRGGGLRQRWLKRRQKLTEALTVIISRGMASGAVRPDVPAEVMAEYLLGMIRTRAIELESAPEPLRSHALMIDLFTNGVACEAGPDRE